MPKNNRGLKKKEALAILEVSPRTLGNYVEQGRLSVHYVKGKNGQEAVYDLEEVQALKKEKASPYPRRPAVLAREVSVETSTPALPAGPSLSPELFFEALKAIAPAPVRKRELLVTELAVKPILKLKEASALTGLGQARLRDAIEKEELKARKIDRSWRIRREDLDSYIGTLFSEVI